MTLDKMPDGASHPFLFKGDGNDSFKDVSDDWGTGDMKGYFNGAAMPIWIMMEIWIWLLIVSMPGSDFKKQCTEKKLLSHFF